MKTDSTIAFAVAICVLLAFLFVGYARDAVNSPEPTTFGSAGLHAHTSSGFAGGGSEHYAENAMPVREDQRIDHGYGW